MRVKWVHVKQLDSGTLPYQFVRLINCGKIVVVIIVVFEFFFLEIAIMLSLDFVGDKK